MTKVICDHCKIEFEVSEDYSAPFIHCPDCRSVKKLDQKKAGEPTFKILDKKGRERAANKVVAEEVIEDKPEERPSLAPKPKQVPTVKRMEHKIDSKVIDEKQLLLDSLGEEGLKKAFELAASYVGAKSEKSREKGRAKAMQKFMKAKYPAEMAAKALKFAESSPETLDLAKTKKSNLFIVFAIIAVLIVVILGILI